MTLRPSYTRFYASKWRSGTLMLTLEEEGLYIRFSAYQMECGQPIPLDWKEGARLLCVQPLKYRKNIDALIIRGLVISTPEGLICERAMLEFKRASKSVEGDKQDPPTNSGTNRDTYPGTNRGTMGVEAKNDESNQCESRNRREEEEKKEDSHHASVEQDATPDRLACLNGARTEIVETLAVWLSPYAPDIRTAEGWLSTACALHGSDVVKRAFGELRAKLVQGDVIARPVPLLNRICERIKAEPKPASIAATPKKSALSIIADMEANNEF